jgi:hypothetical protein
LQAGDPALTVAAEADTNAQNAAEGGAGGEFLASEFGASLPSRGFGGPQAGR